MRVLGKRINYMVKVCISGQMVVAMMGFMLMIRNMDLEYINGQMEGSMMATG
jgi:hypothetical protein